MIPQVFVDLDGVMFDFDAGYEKAFGVRPDKVKDNVDWSLVRSRPGFYANLPMMEDALQLWSFLVQLKKKPIILTGIAKTVPESAAEKREACARHLGADIHVITCPSREKSLYMLNKGDILIDDWDKYRDLWIAAGGHFITHRSAETTIDELLELGIGF